RAAGPGARRPARGPGPPLPRQGPQPPRRLRPPGAGRNLPRPPQGLRAGPEAAPAPREAPMSNPRVRAPWLWSLAAGVLLAGGAAAYLLHQAQAGKTGAGRAGDEDPPSA